MARQITTGGFGFVGVAVWWVALGPRRAAGGALVAAGTGISSEGKTRGLSRTPDGTVTGACHGLQDGAATGALPATTRGALVAEAGDTAYVIGAARASVSAARRAPAAKGAHGRRREGSGGVIAGTD
ncbi:hypothetical protein [Terrabacter sp. BE26]|uniref:hypothetical protein n=1 Tax=Terrabacter sp. BE26 TaxID=2898152 RepID=UPI0035BE558D